MSSVISTIIRSRLAPPPGEIVAAFDCSHAELAYICGGRWYSINQRPLGWRPEKWRKS